MAASVGQTLPDEIPWLVAFRCRALAGPSDKFSEIRNQPARFNALLEVTLPSQ